MSVVAGRATALPFQFDQATLIANTSLELVSPIDGYVETLRTTVQATVTTGGAVTVLLGSGGTAVTGLSVAVANGATKGTIGADDATAGTATRKVAKGDRIQIKPTGFATAGALNGVLVIRETSDLSNQHPF